MGSLLRNYQFQLYELVSSLKEPMNMLRSNLVKGQPEIPNYMSSISWIDEIVDKIFSVLREISKILAASNTNINLEKIIRQIDTHLDKVKFHLHIRRKIHEPYELTSTDINDAKKHFNSLALALENLDTSDMVQKNRYWIQKKLRRPFRTL